MSTMSIMVVCSLDSLENIFEDERNGNRIGNSRGVTKRRQKSKGSE